MCKFYYLIEESTKRLNQHVKEKGLWDFFCSHSNTVLITCMLDGADDVSKLPRILCLDICTYWKYVNVKWNQNKLQ